MDTRSAVGLVVFVAIVFATAAIGSVGTASSVGDWYQTIRKPSFTPPSWVFGPVWTAIYALLAVSAWIVWAKQGPDAAKLPLTVFAAQLALNAGWSLLFFGLRNPGLALIEIVFLWSSVLAMIVLFYRVSPLAGLMNVPYLIWGGFASVLNASIWWLNR